MLNADLVNSSLINSSNVITNLNLETDNVVFNSFSLTGLCSKTSNTMVQTSNYRNLSTVALKTYDFPRIDGGLVLGKKYSKKVVEVIMFINANSNMELETMIDTLKYNTSMTNGILDINFGTSRRQLNATLTGLEIPNFNKLATFIDGIKLTFESYDPNFRDINNSNSVYTGTTANITDSLINIGTAKSIPSYYFIFQSGVSGLNSITINVGGYTISINHTISSSDVLVFDGDNFSVTLNGTQIEYTGIFSEIPVGETPIIITFTPASTFNVDITVYWPKNYL